MCSILFALNKALEQKNYQLHTKMEFLIRIIRYLCYYFPHNKVWMVQKEYFSKMPSELNSNDPFYPILIPNTPYVKFSLFFFLVVGGSPGVPKIFKIFFMILKNYFN